uniref:G-protein coupled receptors family 1 profile domain-containing protein n=1 Tax=Erpetoichthys calabaricus TaxID=27687 RepID=A0A8C4SBV4_ERPCA
MWRCLKDQSLPNASCPWTPALEITSKVYMFFFIPLSLTFNILVFGVNLFHRSSIRMTDIYFTNIALAGMTLNLVASGRLLGAEWMLGSAPCLALFALFNVSSLAFIYSATLLGLDYFIELTLPQTYLSGQYRTHHVCEFIWGGATLSSLSSLLSYACSMMAEDIQECGRLHTQEVGVAILLFVGFLVPAVTILYSVGLVYRVGKEADLLSTPQPSLRPLLLVAGPLTFCLWLPHHGSLLLDLLNSTGFLKLAAKTCLLLQVKRGSELLAYSSGWAITLLYLALRREFWKRFRDVVAGSRWKHL